MDVHMTTNITYHGLITHRTCYYSSAAQDCLILLQVVKPY